MKLFLKTLTIPLCFILFTSCATNTDPKTGNDVNYKFPTKVFIYSGETLGSKITLNFDLTKQREKVTIYQSQTCHCYADPWGPDIKNELRPNVSIDCYLPNDYRVQLSLDCTLHQGREKALNGFACTNLTAWCE